MKPPKPKFVVLIIIIIALAISLVSLSGNPEIEDFVRVVLSFALFWYLYLGKSWARWTVGVIMAMAAIANIFVVVIVTLEPKLELALSAMAAFYLISSILLLTGLVVGPYFSQGDA